MKYDRPQSMALQEQYVQFQWKLEAVLVHLVVLYLLYIFPSTTNSTLYLSYVGLAQHRVGNYLCSIHLFVVNKVYAPGN